MADFTAGFETGVNGNNVLSSDAGDATAWTATPASSALIYDNTRAAVGSLSGKFTVQAGRTVFYWSMSATDHFGRAYLYTASVPAQHIRVIDPESSGGVRTAPILLHSTQKITIQDSGANILSTSANYSVGQWIRLEWHVIHSATVGQIEVKLFNNANSSTPTETLTSPATWNTAAASAFQVFGQTDTDGTEGHEIWWDAIVANATSYPGPAPISPLPILIPSPVRW